MLSKSERTRQRLAALDLKNVAFMCECCGGYIYEGDEYWDIPGVGPMCESCIDDCHMHDAENPNLDD